MYMINQPSQDLSEDVWSRPNWPPHLEKIFVESLIEEMKNLLGIIPSGFKDESWDRAHPKIMPYRKYGCPTYNDLCTIFTRPRATGEYAFGVGGYRSHNNNILCSRENVNISNRRTKRQFAEAPSSGPNKRNKIGCGNRKAGVILGIGTASGSNQTAVTQNNDPYSYCCCITAINGMQGVDRRLYSAAMDLFRDLTWRKTFMSLKSEKRLSWLKAMLSSGA
ncbi:unnamed protein product [Ilex paraguariensis]|uniref:Uncharacterized protein n=1 Tax=Ilex paraguariensis TaxID=185542 RepID=A0ABC8SPB3_9AQUA